VPALFAAKIFPIFIMWETGWDDILGDIFKDALAKVSGSAGGPFWDKLTKGVSQWWYERIENLVSVPGTMEWDEMKQNADAGATRADGGLQKLYKIAAEDKYKKLVSRLRIHLIGHSAGAIFHCHLGPALINAGLRVDGTYFMAPACRTELFEQKLMPLYKSGRIPCYTQFHLSDPVELQDLCTNLYHHSLLYLVSNAFEHHRGQPILGMEKFFLADPLLNTAPGNAAVWDVVTSPTGPKTNPANISNSTSHGGFDNDADTRQAILTRILARRQAARSASAKKTSPPAKAAARAAKSSTIAPAHRSRTGRARSIPPASAPGRSSVKSSPA
jgi:hypothetical protein